ncbi:tetratricopeptide repeat protein [Nocardia sp. NRRL S-836]|uniref:tetratricopeptide repeat protein n=1 Tax=Nocardia sp. NRRL S-836 TaxID=1519492 RepID=UPI0006AF1C61|nr:tetratricopeptide repeat protein [Nocardia sp. NRRL S-836]KOV81759.1 hypothetical protein ADL03_27550 [Nocardia sp. NRRL S-836]
MLKRLIQSLGDAAFDVDATSIADALWLLRHMDVESSGMISTPTAPSSRQSETNEKPPPQVKEEAPPHTSDDDQTGLHALTEETTGQRHAVKTFASTGRGLPQALELARALRPFRTRFRNPAQHELEVDATIERYAETGTLTPVLTPVRERWFSVDLVVDRSVSMSLWEDVIAETRSLLRQTGAFRTIEQWYLDPDSCELRTIDGVVVPSKRLRDPQERRLVIVVSDCIAGGWRDDAMWQMMCTWASSTPTALVNPLPPKLWRRTGLDHPAARLHAGRPGASNPSLRHTLPPLLVLVAPGEQWLPLPVVRLSPKSIAQWAGVLMSMDSAGCEGVLLPSSGRLTAEDDDEWSPDDRVHSFRLSASPLAWRTAVLSSVNDQFPLRLLRLIQRELVPDAELSDLAEVVVSGLFIEVRGADLTELTLKFREGVAGELREHLSKKDEWDTAEVLTSFLDDERASPAGQVAGLVIREGGEYLLPDRLRPYAHLKGAYEGPAAQPHELPLTPLQTRGALFGVSFNNRPFVPMLANLLPDFSHTTHADLTKREVLEALGGLAETSLDGPLVIAWSGHWTDGVDLLMLETADHAYVRVEELVKAGIASGARQILLLLDIDYYMLHSGPKVEPDRWPKLRGNTEWVGVVKSRELIVSEKAAAGEFGRSVSALLTQGPDGDENRLWWLWSDVEVDGAQFIAALQPSHGGELTVHQYGVPQPMLPNPLRGFRRTPRVDDHLLEAARGVSSLLPDLPNIDNLVEWVRSGECGVHAVIGPPAVGKTMAVGYLVRMSNPSERASMLESARLSSNINLSVRSIDANLSVAGMSVDDIAESIGEQILERSWTVRSGTAADALLHLADVLADAKGTPPVIVVDGLNESLDVRSTAQFLAALGERSTMIVTSRELIEELDARTVLHFGPVKPLAIEASDGSGGVGFGRHIELSVKIASPPLYPLVLRTLIADLLSAGRLQQAADHTQKLGTSLQELGRHEEALGAFEEAVMILRRLAEREARRHLLPDVADSLNSLGVTFAELGQREEALGAFEEAVMIRRRLAEMEPSRYLPGLAQSLNRLGGTLAEFGQAPWLSLGGAGRRWAPSRKRS